MNPAAPTPTEYTQCPFNTTCQSGTDGIPSTACIDNESCKPVCPAQKRGLSAGDIIAIILGVLLLAALAWILYSLFKNKQECPARAPWARKCDGICLPEKITPKETYDSLKEYVKNAREMLAKK